MFTFLEIIQARKGSVKVIKDLINSPFFVKLFEQHVKIALNQRQCSELAEEIY